MDSPDDRHGNDPDMVSPHIQAEQDEEHDGSDEGPSQYEYVRPADWTASQDDGEEEEIAEGTALEADVSQAQLADAEAEDSEVELSRHDVEAIVASQLRQLERDYAASIEVDISQPMQARKLPPRLAELAARNPAVAARLAQAREMSQAAEAPVPPPEWETFDFPDDYDELQAADAAALREGGAVHEPGPGPGGQPAGGEWASGHSEAVFGVGIKASDPFEPFEGVAPSPGAPLQPLKLPKLKFVGSSLAGEGKGASPAGSSGGTKGTRTGKRASAPAPRAVSPLSSHARAEIAAAMSRVKVQPRGPASPITEQIVQAALAKAAMMKGQGAAGQT